MDSMKLRTFKHPEPIGATIAGPPVLLPSKSTASARRTLRSKLLLILRRIHLYSGLLLAPLVLLYGITALLFNHPDWFQDRSQHNLSPDTAQTTELVMNSADPLGVAHAIVPLGQTVTRAHWEGSWSFDISQGSRMARVELDSRGLGGRISHWTPRAKEIEAWPSSALAPEGIPNWSPPEAAAQASAASLGMEPGSVQLRRAPRLAFQTAQLGPDQWCHYDPRAHQVTLRERDSDPNFVNALLSLHTAHGNPGFVGPRWWWSWVVDAMGCAMVLWTLSGLLMWWPMRSLRRSGLIVFITASLGIAWLALLMP